MRLRRLFLVGVPLILAAAPFGYSLTRTASLPKLAQIKTDDGSKAAQKLCASRIVNDRLKAHLFREAAAVGGGASSNLDLLASFSEVRMEQPILKDRNADLGVTVCEGRFVVLLPPGSERGFGGMRVLSADVEYAAQPAADGSGLVYQLKGAESIVYRIAAFSLRNHTIVPRGSEMAKAAPPPEMPLAVEPAVWPELARPEEPMPPEPVAPVKVATAAPPAAPIPADPVKVAKAEPEAKKAPVQLAAKVEPKEPKKPVKPAIRSAPTARKEPVKLAAKAEPKVRKEPVKLAAKVEKAPRKPEPKSKPVALAAATRKDTPAKSKPAVAVSKPREQKPARLAAASKPTPRTPTKKEAPVQVAQKKPAAETKPKVQLAAAPPKKPAEPVRDLSANSFLAYEQSRQRREAPAPQPIVQKASAPVARDDCSSGGIEARLVCANPGLASKQRTANNFYYAALEQAGQQARRELTGSRNRFLAYLDRCRSAACASAAYDDRMAEIRDIMREF